MNTRLRPGRVRAALMLAALALPAASCGGGDQKPAKSPTGATAAGGETTAQAATGGSDMIGDTTAPPPTQTSRLSGSSRDAYDNGVRAYLAGDLPGAQAAFKASVDAEPKAYEAHYALGLTDERLGRAPEALEHYREAYKLNPNYEAAIAAYAFLLYKQGSRGEAEKFLDDQSGRNPKAIGVMTALAELKSLSGDSSRAQELAGSALTIEARHEPAMVLIARDHYRRGRLDLAKYVLSAILDGQKTEEERGKGLPAKTNPARAPNNAEAHYLRAVIFQRESERQAAAKWFDSATKLRPDLVEAQLQLGLIRLEANDAEGALEALTKAAQFGPGRVEAHLALGEAFRLAGGRANDAKAQYQWVMAATAASPQQKALAQYDMGLLYFLTPGIDGLTDPQRYDKAIAFFTDYRNAKGTASGPSWPADADDLIEQAKRARSAATAATGGGGATTPKAPPKPSTPPPTTPPPATTPARPAAAPSVAPSPAPGRPAAPAASSAKPPGRPGRP